MSEHEQDSGNSEESTEDGESEQATINSEEQSSDEMFDDAEESRGDDGSDEGSETLQETHNNNEDSDTSQQNEGGDQEDQGVVDELLSGFDENVDIAQEGTETISFRSDNSMAPNIHASKRHFDGYDAIVYMYHEDSDELYIKPLTEDEEDQLKQARPDLKTSAISLNDDKKVRPISSKEIIEQWRLESTIEQGVTNRFPVSWNENKQAVKMDLSEGETVDRSTSEKDSTEENST